MEFFISSTNLNFNLDSTVVISPYISPINFNFGLDSTVVINPLNSSINISYLLEEFYEGTFEYKIVLDFIMGYGGIF